MIIDSGSTGQRLAEVFPVDRDVHVVTNSLITAATLARRGVSELTVLGGGVRTNTFAMVDDVDHRRRQDAARRRAVHQLRRAVVPARAHHAVPRGALLKRAMIERARRIVAIVDQSKFGNDQMFSFAPLDEIDVLVTDTRVDDEPSRCSASTTSRCGVPERGTAPPATGRLAARRDVGARRPRS